MKRRKFIWATAATSAIPSAHIFSSNTHVDGRGLIEIRNYEMAFRGNRSVLLSYLKDTLKPALADVGVGHVNIYTEMAASDPSKIRVVIGYPSQEVYFSGLDMMEGSHFLSEKKTYDSVAPDRPVYSRINSMLLRGFENYPKMVQNNEDSKLFELRIYEGYSEDAVRRKVKMFNVEEIDLFLELDMHPVFFGEMIIGPYCPSLVYMLDFKDMEARNAAWSNFIAHPEWKEMSSKVEYANTVSNIHKIFLEKQ